MAIKFLSWVTLTATPSLTATISLHGLEALGAPSKSRNTDRRLATVIELQ